MLRALRFDAMPRCRSTLPRGDDPWRYARAMRALPPGATLRCAYQRFQRYERRQIA